MRKAAMSSGTSSGNLTHGSISIRDDILQQTPHVEISFTFLCEYVSMNELDHSL